MHLGVGTRPKVLLIAALIASGIVTPVTAQSSFVADMLRAITANIEVENSATAQSALCHGFVDTVTYNIAYVVTAKHCVEDLNSKKLTSTTVDPTLTISVTYSNGGFGTQRRWFWNNDNDAFVLAASFGVDHRLSRANVLSAEHTLYLLGKGFQCCLSSQRAVDHL